MNLRKTSSIFSISSKGGNTIDVVISYEAKRAFINYINTHSKAKERETKCSKIDNITENIEEYFKFKLKDDYYVDVLEMINKNKGIFSESIMKQWIRENYNKNYIKSVGCN
jgi:hypothetical protein